MNIDDEQLHGSQHLPLPFLRDWPSHSFQQVVTQFVAQCIDLLIFQKLRFTSHVHRESIRNCIDLLSDTKFVCVGFVLRSARLQHCRPRGEIRSVVSLPISQLRHRDIRREPKQIGERQPTALKVRASRVSDVRETPERFIDPKLVGLCASEQPINSFRLTQLGKPNRRDELRIGPAAASVVLPATHCRRFGIAFRTRRCLRRNGLGRIARREKIRFGTRNPEHISQKLSSRRIMQLPNGEAEIGELRAIRLVAMLDYTSEYLASEHRVQQQGPSKGKYRAAPKNPSVQIRRRPIARQTPTSLTYRSH